MFVKSTPMEFSGGTGSAHEYRPDEHDSDHNVGITVNNALSSRAIGQFKTSDREVDLVMQYREEDRETLEQLKNVPIYVGQTALPLGALADFEFVAGPKSIERENHRGRTAK